MLIGRGQNGHQSAPWILLQSCTRSYWRAAPDYAMCIVQCMPEMQADKSSWPCLGITCMLGLANAMLIPTRLDLTQNSNLAGPQPK